MNICAQYPRPSTRPQSARRPQLVFEFTPDTPERPARAASSGHLSSNGSHGKSQLSESRGARCSENFGKLREMLQSSENSSKIEALRAINNLESQQSLHATVINNFFIMFPSLVHNGGSDIQRWVALALSRFARLRDSATLIEQIHGMYEITVDLSNHKSVSVRRPASRALALLCIFGLTTRGRLVCESHDAVAPLVDLLKVDSDDFRSDAIRALSDICDDGHTDKVLRAGGATGAACMLFKVKMPFAASQAAELLLRLRTLPDGEEAVNESLRHRLSSGVLPDACARQPKVQEVIGILND